MRRCNCLVFAVFAWWRWRRHGAYFALRLSRHVAGWHWLVNHRGRWIHWAPDDPRGMPAALWHKLWFTGRIRRGDDGPPVKGNDVVALIITVIVAGVVAWAVYRIAVIWFHTAHLMVR